MQYILESRLFFSCSVASQLEEVLVACVVVCGSLNLHLRSVSLDSSPQTHIFFIEALCPDGCYRSVGVINTR